VQCGHTYLNFYNQSEAVKAALFQAPRVPFYFRWLGKRMIVTRSFATDPRIRAGAEVRIPITSNLKQQNGFVHGGVVSYAADNVLTFAGGSVFGPAVVTSEYKISYVRPAAGDELVARASVVHAGKNRAVCRCEVYSVSAGHETLCAVAQGTITLLSQSANSAVF
jgi:uncharacterized protein (TIGR00369 family)